MAQNNWHLQSFQEFKKTQMDTSEHKSKSLLEQILNSMDRVSDWFIQIVDKQNHHTMTAAVSQASTIGAYTRTNAAGIEIIKQFEGFPADVEPDLREAERAVRRLVRVPLTSNQFSALVSFTYNLGKTTLQQSKLLKYLNAGRYRAAAKEFDLWVCIGSNRLSQLVARRVAERGLFLRTES
jgi:GH24 family phage-related lysozyme (muramidase)